MTTEERAIAALERHAASLRARLPSEVTALLRASLGWAGTDPARNSLTPGFPPLEYSFSTWHPDELRVTAQLFLNRPAPDRRRRTAELMHRLTGRQVIAKDGRARRFGAFFGITAGPAGLTGVEAYVEDVALAGHGLRPVFTGIGVRDGVPTRRSYLAVTEDVRPGDLPGVPGMRKALHSVAGGRTVLPAGSVMVTTGGTMRSVELLAAATGLTPTALPARLPRLRTAEYARWAAAIGADAAHLTVVSVRFDAHRGPGVAIYAVPRWASQAGPTSCFI
ncbi:hypothetical protein [Micromonospora aurantiaca (nom. illeg.)]|uniref:hypothetical protein n=1 Tax=Micromonospora aurantiaca (nom. illeg.) TaxID=47850 RepID=UPI0016083151